MLVIIQDKAERSEEYKHPHGFTLRSPDSSIHPALITCVSCTTLTLKEAEAGGLMAINSEDGCPDKTFDVFQRGRGVPLKFHWLYESCERKKILKHFVLFP